MRRGGSLNNAPPADDVVPAASQALLFRRRGGTNRLRHGRTTGFFSWRAAWCPCSLRKHRLRLIPFTTALIVSRVAAPTGAAFQLLSGG